jgi:MFS family permease
MNDVLPAPVPKATHVRFLVLAWLCTLAAFAYVHRSCLGVMASQIERDIPLDREQMGHVLSAFFLGYSLFQLPGGWLGERFGSRVTLTAIVLLWSAATASMGLASGFLGLYVSYLVSGAAQAAIFPCCVGTVARWFPAQGRAFPNGMLGSFMSVGGVLGASLTAVLFQLLDGNWRLILLLLALPGVLLALLFSWWFRDRPQEHSWVNDAERRAIAGDTPPHGAARERRAPTPWLLIFTSVPLLLVCGQQFCRAAAYGFFLTWFPSFLQTSRCVSVVQSGFYASLALMGVVIGSPLGGLLMDRLLKTTGNQTLSRQGVAVGSLLLCATLMSAAFFVSSPFWTVVLMALGSVGGGSCGAAAYTVTIDMGGKHAGAVFSVMNTAGNIGAYVMPLLVTLFVAWRGWDEVLFLLAGLYFTAALCWSLVRVRGSIVAPHPLPQPTPPVGEGKGVREA